MILDKINNILNYFISTYHDCEVTLKDKFDFINDSYSDNKIDFSKIVQNLCYAESLKTHIKKGSAINELDNYLLNSKSMRKHYNTMIKDLKQIAVEMQNLNQLNLFKMFDDSEIYDFIILTEIANNTKIDAVQSMPFLRSIFELINKYKFKINVYINYEWAIVVLALYISNEDNNLDTERKIADNVVSKFINK